MQRAFDKALSQHPGRFWASDGRFAGQPAQLRLVGHQLIEPISQPFSHLLSPEQKTAHPHLKIDLWDESETQVPYPLDLVEVDEHTQRSTWYREYGFIIGSTDDRFVGCQRPEITTWFDRKNQHVIGWISRGERLSLYDCGKPLHYSLIQWHNDRHLQVIHAGLISKHEQGVLFIGKGGTGKTTATLSCLTAGFHFLGDDYIAVQTSERGLVSGYSLYSSAWIMADHVAHFPSLSPHLKTADRPKAEKSLLPLSRILPQQLGRTAPIRALVLPHLVKGSMPPQLRSATKSEALFAIAPSSMILLPNDGASSLNRLAQLVDQLPCYWLEFDRHLEAIPTCIENLLHQIECG